MGNVKATNQASDQDSAKKKEVNWQASVEKEGMNSAQAEANKEPTETTGVIRQESLQRKDSNVGAGKVEGAGQTGTAKRKKKKKEEVTGTKLICMDNARYLVVISCKLTCNT